MILMSPHDKDPNTAITGFFDCSDTKNIGNGDNGKLTYTEIRAVYNYTDQSGTDASRIINPLLRAVVKLPEGDRQRRLTSVKSKVGLISIKSFIRHMDAATRRVNLPSDLKLYRGIDYKRFTEDLGHDMETGVKYRDGGYMSTSYAERVAYNYAVPYTFEDGIERRPIFVITTKAGTTGAVSHKECEVILPRGSGLQCIGIVDVGNRRYFIMDYVDVVKEVEV